MVSIKTRITKAFTYKFINFNIKLHPDRIFTFKNLINKYKTERVRKGYIINNEETINKSRYLVVKKDNNIPAKRVIFYIHGGAYITGIYSLYHRIAYEFCDIRDNIEVVLLDYDLAPEYTYPTQLNQGIDVWNELTKSFKPDDIIIGGDSAGGNLALALILKLKNEQNILPRACFFMSPWTDMTCSGKSFVNNYNKDIVIGEKEGIFTEEMQERCKNSHMYSFIGNGNRKDPYISPLYGDYSSFPKSLFVVGDDEMLLDDTLRVLDKIKKYDDNKVELIQREGMFHVYPLMIGACPESNEDFGKIKEFIGNSFE